ncbi:hypothetical protein [Epilithonimonas caeni]|uniref:hypothetical protein n=1 Tax=Epilithonimonas caeni TaxID=365343 RepID=UPI000426D8EE|nr:hypothetical protein [Epilithonimonas caeni]
MEITIYCTYKDFKTYYLNDFRVLKENQAISIRDYYSILSEKYRFIFNSFPLGKDNQQEKKSFIESTFNKERLENFFLQLIIKEFAITYENAYEITDKMMDEIFHIFTFLDEEILKLPEQDAPKKKIKITLSNSKKIALLFELGIFETPIMKSLTPTKQNEIIGLLLDADPKEFVYKNRLNLISKSPKYQIEKYTAYQYLDEMKDLINNTK